MNEAEARLACMIPQELHPMSESALATLLSGGFETKAAFFRYFALVNSEYLILAECLWTYITSTGV